MSNDKYSLENILKWVVIVVVGLIVLKAAMIALNVAVALGWVILALALKVLPLLLVLWAVVWVVRWIGGKNGSQGTPPATSSTADTF